jgi:hypothetical protein
MNEEELKKYLKDNLKLCIIKDFEEIYGKGTLEVLCTHVRLLLGEEIIFEQIFI